MYHGWSDQLIGRSIPSITTRAYGSQLVQQKVQIRCAFLCFRAWRTAGGGEGPNRFDSSDALAQWVERGEVPDRMMASHFTNGVVYRTRPLCPYAQVAAYKGAGNTDDAATFVCK
jgi:feruloyl esterase